MKKFFKSTKNLLCNLLTITLRRGPFIAFVAFLIFSIIWLSIYDEPEFQFEFESWMACVMFLGVLATMFATFALFLSYDGWKKQGADC